MLSAFLKLLRARDAIAAVEFAFIAPVMILMFFGSVELTMAVDCNTRVASVSSTAADLVAQETTVSPTDMSNVFAALNAIIYPYPTNTAQIVISSIVDAGNSTAKVAWSDAQNGTPRTVNSVVTVPTGLIVSGSGSSVILAEITYSYASPTTQVLAGTISMKSSFYSRPRRSLTVTHTY
jgi:Flp pilus assembly protein TadG